MSNRTIKASLKIASVVLSYLLCVMSSPAGAQSMDELYKLALKEGGTLNFYGTLAQINAERILPVFEKRYPGIKITAAQSTPQRARHSARRHDRRTAAGAAFWKSERSDGRICR